MIIAYILVPIKTIFLNKCCTQERFFKMQPPSHCEIEVVNFFSSYLISTFKMKTSIKQNDTKATKCINHLNLKVLFVLSDMILQTLYTIQIIIKSDIMIHCKPCLCDNI